MIFKHQKARKWSRSAQKCGVCVIHLLRVRKQPKTNSGNTIPTCMKPCHNKKAQNKGVSQGCVSHTGHSDAFGSLVLCFEMEGHGFATFNTVETQLNSSWEKSCSPNFTAFGHHNYQSLRGSLPIASQEAQTRGADFVIEDHQLQRLGPLIVYPISGQVENPPLTVGFGDIVSEQNDGDVHEVVFWRRRKTK